jgi:hypothetical protein
MAKSTRSVRLSEADRFLLETLGKFCVRARHSNWENLTHSNDVEAVGLLNEMSPLLTPSEHRSLMEGWGDIRLFNDEATLNTVVGSITQRLQERAESF